MSVLSLQAEKHHKKRKAEDSPESRGRMQRPYPNPHTADWGQRPASALSYDAAQRAQRGGLQPSYRAGHSMGSPVGRAGANKSPQSHKVC